ncbi:MAG: PCRF domain-containing protein, partial [Gallionellaceae bacterium]|nr:PCRF domain-containing protein [Gallionellaceae bacterium]
MKPNIASKLAQLSERLLEVDQLMSTEEATRNMDTFRKLGRERAELEPVVSLYHAYQSCRSDIETAREMASDPEMKEFAQSEIAQGEEKLAQLNSELQVQLLPKDPND